VDGNQIASFYTGAMANAGELSFRTAGGCRLTIISPNDPEAMVQYADECRALRIPYIWDPGQQCARMEGQALREGLVGAALVVCNDYEFELIRQKTGMGEADVCEAAGALVITRGEQGCSVYEKGRRTDVGSVPPHRIVDPTGVGDAFRGGFMKGMADGESLVRCAQMGSVAATYALEHLGGQSHAYTVEEFRERFDSHYDRVEGPAR
jgi:adenosine kinase